jgi:hypothetical protein
MYKCPVCGFETEHDPGKQYQFWPHDEEGVPFCYKCLIEVLKQIVPRMEKT